MQKVAYTVTSACIRNGELRLTKGLAKLLEHSRPCLIYEGERIPLQVDPTRGSVGGFAYLFEKWGLRPNDLLHFFPSSDGIEVEVRKRSRSEKVPAPKEELRPWFLSSSAPQERRRASSKKKVVRILPGGKEEVVFREEVERGGKQTPAFPFLKGPAHSHFSEAEPHSLPGEENAPPLSFESEVADPYIEAKGRFTGAILMLLDEEGEEGDLLFKVSEAIGNAKEAEKLLDILAGPPLFLVKKSGRNYVALRSVEEAIEEAATYFLHLKRIVEKKRKRVPHTNAQV